jgi:hypothetical protein
MPTKNKPDWAIKFRNFCFNNNQTAKDIAKILYVKPGTVYSYWAGTCTVPDESKKILERELQLDIYDIFYKEL